VWQWIHNKEKLDDGRIISADWVETLIEEELQKIAALYKEHFNEKNFHLATSLFKQLVFAENFIEFLTLEAYKQLGDIHESS